jgi:hypothetical protein
MTIMLPLDPSKRFDVETDMPYFEHHFATGVTFGTLLANTEEAVITSVQVTQSPVFAFKTWLKDVICSYFKLRSCLSRIVMDPYAAATMYRHH